MKRICQAVTPHGVAVHRGGSTAGLERYAPNLVLDIVHGEPAESMRARARAEDSLGFRVLRLLAADDSTFSSRIHASPITARGGAEGARRPPRMSPRVVHRRETSKRSGARRSGRGQEGRGEGLEAGLPQARRHPPGPPQPVREYGHRPAATADTSGPPPSPHRLLSRPKQSIVPALSPTGMGERLRALPLRPGTQAPTHERARADGYADEEQLVMAVGTPRPGRLWLWVTTPRIGPRERCWGKRGQGGNMTEEGG